MIIVIEGPAGAGKTSFVNKLASDYEANYFVLSEYLRDEPSNTKKDIETFIANTELKYRQIHKHSDERHVLVDRGYLSVLVNAYVEQKHNINKSYDRAQIWAQKQRDSGLIIEPDLYVYVTTTKEVILDRAQKGGWLRDDLGWTINPELAMERYEEEFQLLESPLKRLDGNQDTTKLVSEFIDCVDTMCA